jgi:hypothetical protein
MVVSPLYQSFNGFLLAGLFSGPLDLVDWQFIFLFGFGYSLAKVVSSYFPICGLDRHIKGGVCGVNSMVRVVLRRGFADEARIV